MKGLETKTEGISVSFERLLFASYYRDGRWDEARRLATENLPKSVGDERLAWSNNLALIAWEQKNPREALAICLSVAPLAEESRDHLLRANFHNNLANTLRQLDRTDEALIEFEASLYHLEQAGDDPFRGGALNNIALIQIEAGRTDDALRNLAEARRIFSELGEAARVAEVDETTAMAYERQGDLLTAQHYAAQSVAALSITDELAALTRSETTLDRIRASRKTDRLRRALEEGGSMAGAGRILGVSRQAVSEQVKRRPELSEFIRRGK